MALHPLLLTALLSGCAMYSASDEAPNAEGKLAQELAADEDDGIGFGGGFAEPVAASAPMDMEESEAEPMEEASRSRPRPARGRREAADKKGEAKPSADGDDAGEGEGDAPTVRSWFPESMLWEPLVETGPDGVAVVPVTVPDQLTTWRVLALAHDREGQQAGAVHTFDGTLPVYVEPVVPGWLFAGDELLLPVQAMNASSGRVEGRIEVRASGALQGSGVAPVSLGAGGSLVRTLPLSVRGAGQAGVSATLFAGDASDAAERSIPVRPTGRPVVGSVGGVLTDSRSVTVAAPPGTDPSTDRIEVMVFPGPLAVVQAELDRVAGGATSPDGAYGFAVAAQARRLAATTGTELAPDVLRELQIVAYQRVVRAARAPSAGQAADLLLSLGDVEGHALAESLRDRLVRLTENGQRADGTFSREATSTAQRVVVETALAARALPPSAQGARLRAEGAVERLLPQIDDPYTAAVVLASGLVDGAVADALRARVVEEGLVERDGVYDVVVPDARNAWGLRPSQAEVRAVVALALPEHAARGDLVAALMQSWSAVRGFGAGRADPLALEAIVTALPGTTQPVTVVARLDGREVARGQVDPTQPRIPAVLSAAASGGAGALTLTAEPAVPGLAYVATRRSWVPWSDADRLPGVDVEVEVAGLEVGRLGHAVVRLAAPRGVQLTVTQALPAGATVDEAALAAGSGASVARYDVRPGEVEWTTRPFHAGEVLELRLPVVPGFAGRFATAPLQVAADGARPVALAPVAWAVRAGG